MPLSVKILTALLIYHLYSSVHTVLGPATGYALAYSETQFEIIMGTSAALALVLLFGILKKYSWTWILGLINDGIRVCSGLFALTKREELITLTKANLIKQGQITAELTNSQIDEIVKFLVPGILIFVIIPPLVSGFLWFRSQKYFSSPTSPSIER